MQAKIPDPADQDAEEQRRERVRKQKRECERRRRADPVKAERIKEQQRRWRDANPEWKASLNERLRERYANDSEYRSAMVERAGAYYAANRDNPEWMADRNAKSRARRQDRAQNEQGYREKINQQERERNLKRYADDPEYREKKKSENNKRRRALGGSKPHRYGPLVAMRDGTACHICGDPVVLEDGWHVDHYIPRAHFEAHTWWLEAGYGTPDPAWNWRLAHPACNLSKHDALPKPGASGDPRIEGLLRLATRVV